MKSVFLSNKIKKNFLKDYLESDSLNMPFVIKSCIKSPPKIYLCYYVIFSIKTSHF